MDILYLNVQNVERENMSLSPARVVSVHHAEQSQRTSGQTKSIIGF